MLAASRRRDSLRPPFRRERVRDIKVPNLIEVCRTRRGHIWTEDASSDADVRKVADAQLSSNVPTSDIDEDHRSEDFPGASS